MEYIQLLPSDEKGGREAMSGSGATGSAVQSGAICGELLTPLLENLWLYERVVALAKFAVNDMLVNGIVIEDVVIQ